jgi:hypothetical protein
LALTTGWLLERFRETPAKQMIFSEFFPEQAYLLPPNLSLSFAAIKEKSPPNL